MKKLFFGLLFLATVGAVLIGCEKMIDDSSTSGMVSKSSTNSEIQNIINETMKHDDFQSMSLVEERLYETDYYKVLVLDLESDDSKSSVLIVLETRDDYATLVDSQSIRFVKVSEGVSISGGIEHSDDETPGEINGKSTYVCKGSCCLWMQMSPDHFRCDCPNAIDLSTGSDCTIGIGGSGKK